MEKLTLVVALLISVLIGIFEMTEIWDPKVLRQVGWAGVHGKGLYKCVVLTRKLESQRFRKTRFR